MPNFTLLLKNIWLCTLTLCLLSGCMPVVMTGAAGSALEFTKDRPASQTVQDHKIAFNLKRALIKHGFKKLYIKTKIDVFNAKVLLTGLVSAEADMLKIIEIAWQQEGVKEVINELKVDPNSNSLDLLQYSKDMLITSQFKSKTLITREIKFANFTACTINNVIYLFGLARSEQELKQVTNVAASIRGVTKVVSYINLDEAKAPAAIITRPAPAPINNVVVEDEVIDLNLDQGI